MAKTRKAQIDLSKLCEADQTAQRVWEPFRTFRLETVRKYAGEDWSPETNRHPRPVNFLSLYLSTVPRLLISRSPQFALKTFEKEYRAVAGGLEKWGNDELEKIGLAETLHRTAFDSLIGPMGIVKVALTTPAEAEMSGWGKEYGQPGVSAVDVEDFAIDPHARQWSEAAWMRHRVRVMLDSLKGSKLYDEIKRDRLQKEDNPHHNEPGDERIGMLSRGYVGTPEEIYDYCYLYEYYLPRERMVLTLYSDDGYGPKTDHYKGEESAFDEKDWVGPKCGPFHFLRQLLVPGQVPGKGPVQDVVRMDEELNGMYQKLIDQAARQKDLNLFQSGSEKDAERIQQASDGEWVRVDNVDKVKPMSMGGAHPANQAFVMDLWDKLNKVAGNIEVLAGLGQQAGTATQEKLLNANSNRSVTDMQQTTVKFTADVIDSWLWFAHHHPTKQMRSYREYGNDAIGTTVTPAQRKQVPFEAMRLQVHPYSFQYQTPQEMMAFLDQTIMQVIAPMLPLMEKQGIFFDLNKYLELKAKYGNSPDLTEICRISEPVADAEGDGRNDRPKMPVQTERSYNRINRSEKTEPGQSKSTVQALLGQNPGGRPSNNGTYSGAR